MFLPTLQPAALSHPGTLPSNTERPSDNFSYDYSHSSTATQTSLACPDYLIVIFYRKGYCFNSPMPWHNNQYEVFCHRHIWSVEFPTADETGCYEGLTDP